MNVVRSIQAFNAGRDPERLQIKYDKLRRSPSAFLRGTCHRFYERLPSDGDFKSAPKTWVCGDLHLENFGSYKADNRLIHFDISDFDEAALAPASWDLVRILTSLCVRADELGLGGSARRTLASACIESYTAALTKGKALWLERETAHGQVRKLLDGLHERERPPFLDSRTQLRGRKRTLRLDGEKALAATPAQRAAVSAFMAGFARSQPDEAFYEPLDVARRVAGAGSLGLDRFVILVRGKGTPDGNYLLDLKLAQPSSLQPRLKVRQPRWATQAHRIVAVQQRMQAVSMALLRPVMMDGQSYVLRELQPEEDRITLDPRQKAEEELEEAVVTMGRLLAWAQLRSAGREGSAIADDLIEFAGRRKWRARLLDAAQDCALQLLDDAATYNEAFDDGVFRL